jgi:uncharacterized protein
MPDYGLLPGHRQSDITELLIKQSYLKHARPDQPVIFLFYSDINLYFCTTFFDMENTVERFDVMFKGLKAGRHSFDFSLDDSFFEHFNTDELEGGNVHVTAEMDKKENRMTFVFRYSGFLKVTCDRCIDIFEMPVAFDGTLHVRFDGMTGDKDDDVIFLEPNEHKLNLGNYFIESLRLSLPLKRIHPENQDGTEGCNREMLDKLDKYKIKENNASSDPRWDSLKDLIKGGK